MSIQLAGEPPAVAEAEDNSKRIQIWVNESRMYVGSDEGKVHEILSLLERVFHVTNADARVDIDRGGEMSQREYFKGGLFGIPSTLAMQIDEGINMKDKFGG